ncbi:alpha/beta-hydrolase [Neoconidiobolus thromboides FSU 785]|nr:alpha/beta-hydrolase [Neoconidiobolus thromboides FSU 785]
MGSKVIVVKVSSTGSIAERAQQLHELLNKTLPGQQVNLLGHSMGGLDGRYLISRIPNEDKKYKVKSLTTISTPHRGSSFMDWCRDHLKVGKISSEEKIKDKHERQQWFERVMSYLDAPAYSHLTTDYCRNKFNPSTPDDPNVAYYSYNAYLDKMHYLSFLNFPWQIINQVEGKNDGLVSLKSGEWGQLVETVQANHFDLVVRFRWLTAIGRVIGYEDARYNINPSLSLPKTLLLSPETEFDNIEFYLRLSTFLHCKGF